MRPVGVIGQVGNDIVIIKEGKQADILALQQRFAGSFAIADIQFYGILLMQPLPPADAVGRNEAVEFDIRVFPGRLHKILLHALPDGLQNRFLVPLPAGQVDEVQPPLPDNLRAVGHGIVPELVGIKIDGGQTPGGTPQGVRRGFQQNFLVEHILHIVKWIVVIQVFRQGDVRAHGVLVFVQHPAA